MANYAYVENEEIVGVYDLLPNNWRNYSNFFALEGKWDFLKSIGWYKIEHIIPDYNSSTQKIDNPRQWFENDSVYETKDVIDLPTEPEPYEPTAEELELLRVEQTNSQWDLVRTERDMRMGDFEWRYTRYERQVRLGSTTIDSIESLDLYMQQLADITLQEDPYAIIWPVFNEVVE